MSVLRSARFSPILACGTDSRNINKETAMARMPTIVVPGVPLHVTQLNIGREPMFVHPPDYATFLIDLGEAAAVFGCAVHAYVLMPDHLQLLLTPAEADGPSRLMQALVHRHPRRRRGPATVRGEPAPGGVPDPRWAMARTPARPRSTPTATSSPAAATSSSTRCGPGSSPSPSPTAGRASGPTGSVPATRCSPRT